MLSMLPSLLMPVIVLVVFVFLTIRLGLFSARESGGRYTFVIGGVLILAASVWQAVKETPEYSDWFVLSAYPMIDFAQFVLLTLGIMLTVVGLALYADYWQTQRDDIETRKSRLSILDNLHHDARQPYHLLELLNISLKEIMLQQPMASGALFLVNRTQRRFVLTSSQGLSKEETALAEYYPLGRNIASQALELGDPTLVSRFEFIDRSGGAVATRFKSCLILPLTSGMEKIGLLILWSEETKHFSTTDIEYLAPVVQWLAEKIRSARLARELSQAQAGSEEQSAGFAGMLTRFGAVSRALNASDPLTAFCQAMAGTIGSESVHLCGMQEGELVIHSGSTPMLEISENYRTALIDAVDRTRPLIINQENTDPDQAKGVIASSLVFPLVSKDRQDALLFVRSGHPFKVNDDDLAMLESFAWLAALVLRRDDGDKLSLMRRTGFDAVLKMLKSDSKVHRFEEDPGEFIRTMVEALPFEAIGLSFYRDEGGALTPAAVTGVGLDVGDLSFEVFSGEGALGDASLYGDAQFAFGKDQVKASLESYDGTNRDVFNSLFGESGTPDFVACLPITVVDDVVGVTLFAVYDLQERDRGEMERLLLLAAELYALRLTMVKLLNLAREETSGQMSAPVMSATASAGALAEINDRFAAIIGIAKLAEKRPDISGENEAVLRQIIEEAEETLEFLRQNLAPAVDGPGNSEPIEIVRAKGVNDTIEEVLESLHVSGDLYMAGQRPREIRLKLDALGPIALATDEIRDLFESVLNRFSSIAHDDDVISVATYTQDGYAYLDVSRHPRNFPPVKQVAGFGQYSLSKTALENRPGDVYLRHLKGAESYYSVDNTSAVPSFLSFKFPLRRIDESTPAEGPVSLLAIDDHEVILDLISAMGKSLGYHVTTALSGEEGLELAREGRFDLILTDLTLPGVSGLDVARRIRADSPELPIILVTGWESKLDSVELSASGISRVLYKPFRIEQLTDIVQSVIARS